LELAQQSFCHHLALVPEAASLLFRGGFPRGRNLDERAATQRAIFYVQRELESAKEAAGHPAALLCDRGTVDGAAYWPGPQPLWSAVGTTRDAELQRYDAVIHLRVPGPADYNQDNAARIETAEEAAAIDLRIAEAWAGHPRRSVVDNAASFLDKAHQALDLIDRELPACCRRTR
jgi:hypothetical protein